MPNLDDYEPLAEWARRTGTNPSLARRWCRTGKLSGVKIGRDWFVEKNAEPNVKRRDK